MTRREGVQLAALLVASAVLYATHSFLRYATYEAKGYDLGIFDQVVRQYALFNAPLSSVKGVDFHILGDHFHPILALLAPFYWVWPDPRMLGVVMALALAASAVPVYRSPVVARDTGWPWPPSPPCCSPGPSRRW